MGANWGEDSRPCGSTVKSGGWRVKGGNWVCFFNLRDEVSGSFGCFGMADSILSLGALLWLCQTLLRLRYTKKGGKFFVVLLDGLGRICVVEPR